MIRAFLLLTMLSTPLLAQQQTVESDPIRCWLKAEKPAVHIGEQFTVALTCAIVDTGHVTVKPDIARIEPEAIALSPFEVVRGTHYPDVRSGVWRYIQYEYQVRLVEDGFFGQEVEIPAVTISYTVHTSGGGADQEGIARSYVLPSLPVRIHSLVPQNAQDIRDTPRGSFAGIDARKFRSTAALTAATILFAFAALFFLLGVARGFARFRKRARGAEPTVSAGAALQASLGTLNRVDAEVATAGWSPALIGEALAALRVGASVACGKSFAQSAVPAEAGDQEGQVPVRLGLIRRRHYLISGSATPNDVPVSSPLGEALSVFSEARYGRDAERDRAAFDRALESGRDSIRQLRRQQLWPLRIAAVRNLVWTR